MTRSQRSALLALAALTKADYNHHRMMSAMYARLGV